MTWRLSTVFSVHILAIRRAYRKMRCLGIDTSNYTTSLAIYDTDSHEIIQAKKLLPVREGELGLRQSDAVFHHTRQLPELAEELFSLTAPSFDCVAVSSRPRNIDGSYMPCFLAGEGLARTLAASHRVSLYRTSHQIGHILAALYSADRLSLLSGEFIAFHVSGGTTDCLLVKPDADNLIDVSEISSSLDLKAGQLIDRVGLMLGLSFPCGKELEKLAATSTASFREKAVLKDGNCCLSGVENKCRKLIDSGASAEDAALFCLESVYQAVSSMTEYALDKFGKLPVIYAGGVMSDKIIADKLRDKYDDVFFATPDFSCDNSAGVALFGSMVHGGE